MDFFDNIAGIQALVPEIDAATKMVTLERSFTIARNRVTEITGTAVYNFVRDKGNDSLVLSLKSCLVNFMMYEHVTFSEAGRQKEKKMFKYEYEQVREKYIDYGYSYLDELLNGLEGVKEWEASEQKKSIGKLLVSATDMKGLSGFDSMYFYFRIRNIIRDVADDEIYPQYPPEKIRMMDESTCRRLKRATVYFSLARAICEYDYCELPRPLRSSLQSEYASGSNSREDLSRIADTYRNRALDLMGKVDFKQHPATYIEDRNPITEKDKFYLPTFK